MVLEVGGGDVNSKGWAVRQTETTYTQFGSVAVNGSPLYVDQCINM